MSDDNQELLENIIMKFMFTDEKVRDKIVPYLRFSIFDVSENVDLVKYIKKFKEKYDKFPSAKEARLTLKNADVIDHLQTILKVETSEYNTEMILSEAEEYIRQRCIMDVCFKVAEKVSNEDMSGVDNAPDEMREALAFSFDNTVGLDIFDEESEDKIFDHFHNTDFVISSGLDSLDELIEGGFHEKTLTLFLAPTNMGKSLIMGALGVNNLFQDKKVLYITCEMSEFKISERVLANALGIGVKDLKRMSKGGFHEALVKSRNKFKGKFVVKEYSTGACTVADIRNVIKELKLKKNFEPDIIYIDYIGIMSSTVKSKNDNTYTSQKRITEEVRGLAIDLGLPIVSAIQTSRSGIGKDELDLTDISDSIGTAFTADIIIAVTQSDELRASFKYRWEIIKNRHGLNNQGIAVKVDYDRMKLEDDECMDDKMKSINNNNQPTKKHNDESKTTDKPKKEKSSIKY
jgi:putative sterol carrier protein